jgi:hypothetical protein
MTWEDLIIEVRAQVDVDPGQAYAWLLDRARVMNAEAAWRLLETTFEVTGDVTEYELPDDAVRVEALVLGDRPFRRSTLSALDYARAQHGTTPIYADGVDNTGTSLLQIWPPAQGTMTLRYLGDVPEVVDDDFTTEPPFPADVQQALADGAIGIGLARMDERFDSAGWFDARFVDGVQRLKRRRHGHVGRGGTPIRLVR